MNVSTAIKSVIIKDGRRQSWVSDKMNEKNESIKMNQSKLSAIVCGRRKMTADELLAFCDVMDISPDELFGEEVI